jgi:protein TonB
MMSIVFVASAHSQDHNTAPDTKTSAPPAAPTPRTGKVENAKLIHRVEPVYPPDAKKAGVSGTVVLNAVIAKDGTVQKVQYVSGPKPLVQSATDAVTQWRYAPTTLNGEPVDVKTNISVVYNLDAAAPSAAEESAAIDPQYKADVMRLLEATHYREAAAKAAKASFETSRAKLEESFPDTPSKDKIIDSFASRMVDLIQSQEFADRIVIVYHKYLSDDDVKNLTQFYSSPAGQHFSAAELDMIEGLGRAGNQVARDGLPGIFKGLCNDYPELQGKAKFCPAPPENTPAAPETPTAPSLKTPPTTTPSPAPSPPPQP